MPRFSTERFNLRARPWLVLWLLPYLVLSIAATAHNHDFGAKAAGPGVTLTVHAAQASGDVSRTTATVASDITHEMWCLACQWAGFAAAILTPALVLLLVVGSLPAAYLTLLSSRRAPVRVTVRGPPSS